MAPFALPLLESWLPMLLTVLPVTVEFSVLMAAIVVLLAVPPIVAIALLLPLMSQASWLLLLRRLPLLWSLPASVTLVVVLLVSVLVFVVVVVSVLVLWLSTVLLL